MDSALEFYKKLNDDTNSRLEQVLERNNQLEKDVSELRKQMLDLSLKICLNLSCTLRIRTEEDFNNRYKEIKEEN